MEQPSSDAERPRIPIPSRDREKSQRKAIAMTNSVKRYWVVVILLGATFLASSFLFSLSGNYSPPVVDIHNFPMMFGNWVGEEVAVSDRALAILETESVLGRRYVNLKDGKSVFLSLVYYADVKTSFHLPESCFAGTGSHLIRRSICSIPVQETHILKANELIFQEDKGYTVVLYWYQAGKRSVASYLKTRLYLMLHRSSASQIRVHSSTIGESIPETEKRVKQFIKDLAPLLSNYLP